MVFYEPPPRRATPGAGEPSRAGLPEEMRMTIVGKLPTADITRLRLTNSQLVGACNDILVTRNTILYLHPPLSSLRQAVTICQHPLFRGSIRTILLLGQVQWADIEACVPQIRDPACLDTITAQSVKGRFAAWPSRPYSGKIPARSVDHKEYVPFETGHAPLFAGLASLPHLHQVAFSASLRAPGWNQTRAALVTSHANACSQPPVGIQHTRHSDVDVVFHILCALRTKITSLSLDADFPFAGPTVKSLRRACETPQMPSHVTPALGLSCLRDLASLDLVLPMDARRAQEHPLMAALIACAASALRSLRIVLVPQHAKAQDAVPRGDLTLLSPSSVLSFGTQPPGSLRGPQCDFHNLESLILEAQDPPVPRRCVHPRRRARPSCQTLDFPAFLHGVSRTIQRVSIHNTIFAPSTTWTADGDNNNNNNNPATTALRVHEDLTADYGAAFPALESFAWRVNRYDRDPRCRSTDAEHGSHPHDCDRFRCGYYVPHCSLETLAAAAETLGAGWEGSRDGSGIGMWDFGMAIMRAREMGRGEGGLG